MERRKEIPGILGSVRRFALSLAGNVADADDLLQSTVERLLAREVPADAELLPWSLRVCRNLWIDEIRSRKVRQAAAADAAYDDEQVVHGERQAHGELALQEVQQTLRGMPEEQRAVLELVAVEGYSYKEAAAVLEIPIGTVMSRLARARATLIEQAAI